MRCRGVADLWLVWVSYLISIYVYNLIVIRLDKEHFGEPKAPQAPARRYQHF